MAKVTEITVWTRGVIMDKEARDVANAFAQAAKLEGKFVQAFDNYEDLPDRVLVTTRKYARILTTAGITGEFRGLHWSAVSLKSIFGLGYLIGSP